MCVGSTFTNTVPIVFLSRCTKNIRNNGSSSPKVRMLGEKLLGQLNAKLVEFFKCARLGNEAIGARLVSFLN